jgi:hypothetical protein
MVFANFLGIIIQPFLKSIGHNCGNTSWISIRLNDPHACVFIWLVSNMREPLNKGTRVFDASETKLEK